MGREQGAGLGVAALGVGGGALEHRDGQAAAGDALLADAVGGGEVDRRSRPRRTVAARWGRCRSGRPRAMRLRQWRSPGRTTPRSATLSGTGCTRTRTRVMTPKTPSEPQNSSRKIRAGGRGGRATEIERAGRGDHPHAADHVVEPAVAGGVLAGGPGRGVAADAGEPEALREVAEGEAALAEQALGLRAGEAGAQFGFAGDLVEPVQGVEAAQVQGDDGVEVAADRIEAADHAGAAAERHDGDALAASRIRESARPRPRCRAGSPRRGRPGGSACGAADPASTCRRRTTAGRGRRCAGTARRRSRPGRRGAGGLSVLGETCTSSMPGPATSVPETPRACSSRVRMPADSGLARAGSPQASQAIGGSRFSPAVASTMGYSITDVVNQ